jgi:hypothetical protein
MPDLKVLRRLDDVKSSIHGSDLLLFRRRGLISIAGRGEHSHAAKAAWWGGHLFCVEVREWYGGRIVTLESQVRKFPGRIDVYRPNPDNRWPNYNPAKATGYMLGFAGCGYGYAAIARAALLHLPLVRLFARADVDDQRRVRRPPFCSAACAMADHWGGGVDPVQNLADWETEPADLARSDFYEYQFTLMR